MNYLATSINESPVIAFPASADLGDVRGKAVSLDENGTLILTATGKLPLGIAVLGNPEQIAKDDAVTVQIKDVGCVKAGAAVQSGDALTVDSSGAFVPATSGNYYAVALETGAKDAFIRAILRNGSLAAASGGAMVNKPETEQESKP